MVTKPVVYHSNPEINAGIILDSLACEAADLAAGYPPRRWRCPCGAEHGRGHFPIGAIGSHRCLRCGYVGVEGVMFVDEGRTYAGSSTRPPTRPRFGPTVSR